MGNLLIYSPPPGAMGSQVILKDIVIRFFDYTEQNVFVKAAIGELWGEMSVGALAALQYFWSFKKGTRTFYLQSNEPSPDLLGSLVRYSHPCEKKQTKNK